MTPTKDWQAEFDEKFGSFEFCPQIDKPGYLKLKAFIASKIQEAEEGSYKVGQWSMMEDEENKSLIQEERLAAVEEFAKELKKKMPYYKAWDVTLIDDVLLEQKKAEK